MRAGFGNAELSSVFCVYLYSPPLTEEPGCMTVSCNLMDCDK